MKRTICPQVKGIYYSNIHQGEYRFLLVDLDNPDEEYKYLNVQLVNKFGYINPDIQEKITVNAEDFGDYYYF